MRTYSAQASPPAEVGDHESKVLHLLGNPKTREFHGTKEAWQYCQSFYTSFVLVWIENGHVTGLRSWYDNDGWSVCENSMREVDWDEAPDRQRADNIYEIRR